jgi:hypothetical protein
LAGSWLAPVLVRMDTKHRNQAATWLPVATILLAGGFTRVAMAGNPPRLDPAALATHPDAHEVLVEPGKEIGGIDIEALPVSDAHPVVSQAGVGEKATAAGAAVPAGSAVTLFLAGENLTPGTFYAVSSAEGEVTIQQPEARDFTRTADGKSAVRVKIRISPSAAPGPRNILVSNASGEVSVLVGGLLITEAF